MEVYTLMRLDDFSRHDPGPIQEKEISESIEISQELRLADTPPLHRLTHAESFYNFVTPRRTDASKILLHVDTLAIAFACSQMRNTASPPDKSQCPRLTPSVAHLRNATISSR